MLKIQRRYPIISLLTLLLLLQAWIDVSIDALINSHYWNIQREQFEHVPENPKPVFWDGTVQDTYSAECASWLEIPCPVLAFMNSNCTDEITETNDSHCVLCEGVLQQNKENHIVSVSLVEAPKNSPPFV